MDASMFDGMFKGLFVIGICIGLLLAVALYGLWQLIVWLSAHVHIS